MRLEFLESAAPRNRLQTLVSEWFVITTELRIKVHGCEKQATLDSSFGRSVNAEGVVQRGIQVVSATPSV